jgi:c-di-AMP phosphodiesterase-like protein
MLLYFVFLYIFVLAAFFYNINLGIAEFIAATIILTAFVVNNSVSGEKFKEYIENLSLDIEAAAHNSVLKSPFPMVILKENGDIIWHNNLFSDIIADEWGSNQILDIFPGFALPEKEAGSANACFEYAGRSFDACGILVERQETGDNIYVYYLVETTGFSDLKKTYHQNSIVKGLIYIDNLDEVTKQISDSERTVLTSHIEKKISDFIVLKNGVLNKFDRDRYSFIIERKNFDLLRENKFEILKEVKQIDSENVVQITLSIGVGIGESLTETENFSRAALDMALGRGGDQAVIKEGNDYFYFGGQNRETEKRVKVRSRIIALAFREFVENSDKVIIMGHKSPDMDFLGAALGLARIALSYDKKAYIVVDEKNENTGALFAKTQLDREYDEIFISPSQAELHLGGKTIIVVADTHREALVTVPEILGTAENSEKKIFLIDHHRKGADFIKNTSLTFHEPYASSTCELVVEMLQYLDDKVKLKRVDAEALYAGILIDTQNFSLRTGIRTFEAASYLRKIGMEPMAAKDLIKNDFENYGQVSEIVKSAEICGTIAISKYYGDDVGSIFIAQAADDLVAIKGISAAFVIFKKGDLITISARSNGNINVQLIMEKLGGGGHQLVAGAQVKGSTVDTVIVEIKHAIEEVSDNG